MMINAATDADDLPSLFVCGIANVSTYKFLKSISSLEYDDELWLVKAYCKTLRSIKGSVTRVQILIAH